MRSTLLIMAGLAACGGEERSIMHDAGPLLAAHGVDRYALRISDVRWEVELFAGGDPAGTMVADLDEGAPTRVVLEWKGVVFDIAPDREQPEEVSNAIALIDALSAEIINGGPIELPEEQAYASTQTGGCSSTGYGPFNTCDNTYYCALGNALGRCPYGGYILNAACSCGWFNRYCQATAYCY